MPRRIKGRRRGEDSKAGNDYLSALQRYHVASILPLCNREREGGRANMKLLYFNDFRLGVLKGDSVVDVTPVVQNVPHTGPGNLIIGVIERWPDLRGPLERAAGAGGGVPVTQVKIRPPLPKPVNVDCMAVNYMEDGTRKEPAPINAFHQSPGCIVGHGDTVILPD